MSILDSLKEELENRKEAGLGNWKNSKKKTKNLNRLSRCLVKRVGTTETEWTVGVLPEKHLKK
jgi:hypothetical protein